MYPKYAAKNVGNKENPNQRKSNIENQPTTVRPLLLSTLKDTFEILAVFLVIAESWNGYGEFGAFAMLAVFNYGPAIDIHHFINQLPLPVVKPTSKSFGLLASGTPPPLSS